MRATNARRFQFSVRSLLVTAGALTLLLVPAASLTRERQQALRAREVLLHAREEALRAVVLGERGRAPRTQDDGGTRTIMSTSAHDASEPTKKSLLASPTLLERLERENAELRDRVDHLSREVQRLDAANRGSSSQTVRLVTPGTR